VSRRIAQALEVAGGAASCNSPVEAAGGPIKTASRASAAAEVESVFALGTDGSGAERSGAEELLVQRDGVGVEIVERLVLGVQDVEELSHDGVHAGRGCRRGCRRYRRRA
jgi:hypothetical protein